MQGLILSLLQAGIALHVNPVSPQTTWLSNTAFEQEKMGNKLRKKMARDLQG